ncbi:hypothetical protein [Nibribacter koreensis]|uniref:Uncharacterized protein n=1 Tax=Nibribacter koreensis TaxID=1084519 RepID=A0ABP8F663_9BACT
MLAKANHLEIKRIRLGGVRSLGKFALIPENLKQEVYSVGRAIKKALAKKGDPCERA